MGNHNTLQFALLVLLCLGLTACGGSKKNNPPQALVCTGAQALNADQSECVACSAGEFPNADRTACVSRCDTSNNEYKPTDKPTCETLVSCDSPQVHNPATNTCIALECEANKIIDTTVNTPACIATATCQTTADKVVSVDSNACITATACVSIPGQVAKADGSCEKCMGATPIRNADQTSCIDMATCTTQDSNSFSVLDNAECISDANCIATDGRVATAAGVCETCSGTMPHVNTARTACGVDDDSDGVFNGDDAFPDDTCASVDSDSDDVPDNVADSCSTTLTADNCPNTANTDQANWNGNNLGDACEDSDSDSTMDHLDVDKDNDGLIEIVTATQLNNIRWNLAGTSYDDEEADDTTGDAGSTMGAPMSATANCGTATGGVYLCGYELVADIDFFGGDGAMGGGDDIDLNGSGDR